MRVIPRMNILLDGKKLEAKKEVEVSKEEYERIKSLVDVVETVEDKVVKPEEKLENKVVKPEEEVEKKVVEKSKSKNSKPKNSKK